MIFYLNWHRNYSHLPNKWGGSNNRGGWKVSKMGRVKMHLINRERGKFPKRGGRRSMYLIKGEKGNASHKNEGIYPKKWRSNR